MNSEKASSKKIISQKEYLKRYLSSTKTETEEKPIEWADVKVIKIISQKEYLKKYLSNTKTKTKKKPIKWANVKVIDDNDLTSHHTEENFDLETGEDAPVIAAVIDDRPKTIQRLEAYKTNDRWAPVPQVNDAISENSSHKRNQRDHYEEIHIHDDTESGHDSPTVEPRSITDRDKKYERHSTSRFINDTSNSKDKRSGKLQNHSSDFNSLRSKDEKITPLETGESKYSSSSSKNESEWRNRKTNVENIEKPTAEQYYQWGKGLKQIEDENEKLAYSMHEMSKPLARYADDEDLDKHLRNIERDGDPLAIIRRNLNDDSSADGAKPKYKGTYPQNRFEIPPGHKWDGVDRSNGYEVKWLGKAKAEEAVKEEAYKWSTEDM
ncbi:BUD13 homolog isoform X2 [Planococcus citri]|uniref:BUD13 homolog isoform X2 n=1 Tax=Planococcus citri TaxID=170843 RepID=UPI0031FA39DF